MKKFNLFNTLILLISTISLTSCDLSFLTEGLLSAYNSEVIETESRFHTDDCGNSLEVLGQAFNGVINEHGGGLRNNFSSYSLEYNNIGNNKVISFNQNVTDLEYNDGLTPTKGKINGLVIPVDFEDCPALNIYKTFTEVSYQSVSSYYYNSSYGQLDMHFDILPWFRLSKSSNYYEKMTTRSQSKYTGDVPGVSAIIDEALTAAAKEYDLTKYDNDNDGYIDSLHIIYSHPVDYDDGDFWWAYQYCTFENFKYDNKHSYFYVFAGYNFLFDDSDGSDPSTFIHETGHMLGLEDYYDYDDSKGYNKGSLGGLDMMDCTIGDHNAFSKISLGWIDRVLLIDLKEKESTTVYLKNFSKTGQVIMVCDNYNEEKGMFQQYFLFQLIDVDSLLNEKSYSAYNIKRDGIRVLRVNAELEEYTSNNSTYKYYKYDNSYTRLNLIDAINAPKGNVYSSLYYNKGVICENTDLFFSSSNTYSLPYATLNGTLKSDYYFKVNELNEDDAKITFYRN